MKIMKKMHILVNYANSILLAACDPSVITVDASNLRSVILESAVWEERDNLLMVVIKFSFSDDTEFGAIYFDANTQLFAALYCYRSIVKQLGIPVDDFDFDEFIPPELRHLIDQQPEVTGRP